LASSPGSINGDGCLAAEERLHSGDTAVSEVVFDGGKGRLRQSNIKLEKKPTQNMTNIGRWDLSIPSEWDLITDSTGELSCNTEPLPPVMCPNGTLPPSCPPQFGTWGGLNPFTSVLGMWYPNTTKLKEFDDYDLYQYEDVTRTLLPNDGCGTSDCIMSHCSSCTHNSVVCTKCPCENCIMAVNVTRNYTYTVAKSKQLDGTRQLMRFQWTQGIPLNKSGGPGRGRDCFIFDWSQGWSAGAQDADFSPPSGAKCTPQVGRSSYL
jgi:hypothetical protein